MLAESNMFVFVTSIGISRFLLAASRFIFFRMATAGQLTFGSRMAKGKVSDADVVHPELLLVFLL